MSCRTILADPGVNSTVWSRSSGVCPGCALVLARCGRQMRLTQTEEVAMQFGMSVFYEDCDPRTNARDAKEVALYVRWVVRHFEELRSGVIQKVVFHHCHEKSWHQRQGLATQIKRLMEEQDYFLGSLYGEMYPRYVQNRLVQGHSFCAGVDFLEVMERVLANTSFLPLNTSNARGIWLSGMCACFFVDRRLLAVEHSKADWESILRNTPSVVDWLRPRRRDANYFVAISIERAWNVMFTNNSMVEFEIPASLGETYVHCDDQWKFCVPAKRRSSTGRDLFQPRSGNSLYPKLA